MDPEKVIESVLAIMVERGMLVQHSFWEAKDLAYMIYTAGFDEGRKQVSHRKRVIQFNTNGDRIEVHESASSAANKIGLTKYSISKAALGKIATAGGYIWRYENDENSSRDLDAGD